MKKTISIFTVTAMLSLGLSNQLFAQQEHLNNHQAYSSQNQDANYLAQGSQSGSSASAAGTSAGFWTCSGLVLGVAGAAVAIFLTNGETTNNQH